MFSSLVTCDPPCQNKAPCVSTNKCNCPPSFTGDRCETPGNDTDDCYYLINNIKMINYYD